MMARVVVVGTVCAVGLASAAAVHAQTVQDTTKPAPVLALVGCLEPASEVKASPAGRGGAAAAQPADWMLTHVTPAVIAVTPKPAPGASGATGADGTAASSGATAPSEPPAPPPPAPTASAYALDIKDNMAKPRSHQKIEVIGQVAQPQAAAGRGRSASPAAQIPVLKVESIAAVAPTCS